MSNKLQNSSFKSAAEAGNVFYLTDDSKVFLSESGYSKTLSEAFTNRDFSGHPPVISNSAPGNYPITYAQRSSTIVHRAGGTATYLLPAAVAGIRFTFIYEGTSPTSIATNELRVSSYSLQDTIYWGNQVVGNPGYISLNKRGVSFSLYAINNSTWVVDQNSALPFIKESPAWGSVKEVNLIGRDSWVTKASPVSRHGSGGFSLSNYGYRLCGIRSITEDLTRFLELYNTTTDTWGADALPTSTSPRHQLTSFSLNGYAYGVGGTGGVGTISLVEQYVGLTQTISIKTSYISPISGLASFSLNGYAYGIGGLTDTVVTSTVGQYNDSANSWSSKASYIGALTGLTGFSLSGYGCVSAGTNSGESSFTILTSRYNDTANVWAARAYLTYPRAHLTGYALNGYGYSIGGRLEGVPTNAVERLDDATNSYTSKTNYIVSAADLDSFTIDGFGYVQIDSNMGQYN